VSLFINLFQKPLSFLLDSAKDVHGYEQKGNGENCCRNGPSEEDGKVSVRFDQGLAESLFQEGA
jgi:hypothetical protein